MIHVLQDTGTDAFIGPNKVLTFDAAKAIQYDGKLMAIQGSMTTKIPPIGRWKPVPLSEVSK